MGSLIGVLVIAALIGAVVWNHSNKAKAMEGVEFETPEPPAIVIDAISALHIGGAKAAVKSFLSGVKVVPSASQAFRFDTKIGDRGEISVLPQGRGSLVRAYTTELYIGTHPRTHSRSGGYWGFASVMAHRINLLLGIAPSAAKLKRFQGGLEIRIARHLGRAPSQLQAGTDRISGILKRDMPAARPPRDAMPAALPAPAPPVKAPAPVKAPVGATWDAPPPGELEGREARARVDPLPPAEPFRQRPRLPPAFCAELLAAADLPVTGHNVRALSERVATMFLLRGRQFVERLGTADELARFEAACGQPHGDLTRWPQEILDWVAAWNPQVAAEMDGLPGQVRAFLLRSADQPGSFLGGPPSAPLPGGRWTQAG